NQRRFHVLALLDAAARKHVTSGKCPLCHQQLSVVPDHPIHRRTLNQRLHRNDFGLVIKRSQFYQRHDLLLISIHSANIQRPAAKNLTLFIRSLYASCCLIRVAAADKAHLSPENGSPVYWFFTGCELTNIYLLLTVFMSVLTAFLPSRRGAIFMKIARIVPIALLLIVALLAAACGGGA